MRRKGRKKRRGEWKGKAIRSGEKMGEIMASKKVVEENGET